MQGRDPDCAINMITPVPTRRILLASSMEFAFSTGLDLLNHLMPDSPCRGIKYEREPRPATEPLRHSPLTLTLLHVIFQLSAFICDVGAVNART